MKPFAIALFAAVLLGLPSPFAASAKGLNLANWTTRQTLTATPEGRVTPLSALYRNSPP